MTRYRAHTEGLDTWSRSWEVQRAPFNHPLPYRFNRRRESQYLGVQTPGSQVNDAMYMLTELNWDDWQLIDSVVNQARSRCLKQAKGSGQAALGLTIIDWRSSLSMISGALRALASKRSRARLYYRRKASDIYLEGVFGWVPLMSDIYQAMEVLSSAHRISPSRAKAQNTHAYSVADSTVQAGVFTDARATVGVRLSLDNPNVVLLNNLGVLNPASIAWDMVPYSFVINWFVPVGTYLNSLTELLGYGVHDGFVTTFVRKFAAGSYLDYNRDSQTWEWYPRHVEQINVVRQLGFPPFSLPAPSLPTADLGKALISLALFDKTREPAPTRR